MLLRYALITFFSLFGSGLLSGCSTSRQIVVDYPKNESSIIQPLKGQSTVTADDYYMQWVSEFEFKGDSALKGGCSDVGASYETGDISAALLFNVHNQPLKFQREVSGFLYQATTGKCNYKLETKKAYLSPWLRLDLAKGTQLEYRFLTSNSRETNLSEVVGDINAASNLMALTGVGTGIAVMGKLAGSWMGAATEQPVSSKPSHSAKYSSETHTLPDSLVYSGSEYKLNQSKLAVYEVIDGGFKAWASETKLLGEMHIYPELSSSLLIKTLVDGVPDAHDLSLEELWRMPIQTVTGEVPLKELVVQIQSLEQPNLTPDWQNYADIDNQCHRLKLVLRGLGFNKFDRNAVLFYFLAQSPDWQNYNISAQKAMADAVRPTKLEQYRSKNFSECLAADDYSVMKSMNLVVNTEQDWDGLISKRQKKESVFSSVQSIGRQFLAALKQADKDEMAKQLYPLFLNEKAGHSSVLLQNHLGNFGLENLLQLPPIPDEGVTVDAGQFTQAILGLMIESYSCVRPAQQQGQPLSNIGILLFVTKPGSPREKGGAMEFELVNGKIARLAFQHPSFRDFEQNIVDYPDLGGCRIEADFLTKLH